MKKHFYLLSIVMLASSLFMAAPAKAESSNSNTNNQGGLINDLLDDLGLGNSSSSGSTSGSGSNCALPINDDIVYLLIGSAVIGITTLNRKTLALKA